MSNVYHTPYEDDVTQFKASHMNAPLSELDTQMHTNVEAIDALEVDINQTGLSAGAGKFAMVNAGGTAMIFRDIICHGGQVVVNGGQVVVN